ncbi:MAG: sialidase family protein, partial [Planctomycetota bacterium]
MKTVVTALLLAGICLLGERGVSGAGSLFEKTDVFTAGMENVCEYRIPSLVTTDEGTLIAVCDARVEKPGDAINNIDLAMKRSFNNGRTWEPVRILANFPGQEAAADPCMLVDCETDTVWILYDYILGEPSPNSDRKREQRVIMLHMILSRDDGQTWSEPIDITTTVKQAGWEAVAAAPGRGIQTRDGR